MCERRLLATIGIMEKCFTQRNIDKIVVFKAVRLYEVTVMIHGKDFCSQSVLEYEVLGMIFISGANMKKNYSHVLFVGA